MPLVCNLFVYLQKPKHCIDMEKNEITNKPKEIKIEISCEIVDDGKTPKIKYKNRWFELFWLSFVAGIVFPNDVIAVILMGVAGISLVYAVPKSLDRAIFPDKYE